jgi:hypothetical protein
MNHTKQIEFLKFIIVGMINTMVTLVVIFTTKSLLGLNPYLSNALGYVAGLTNSFIWNKAWVFRSKGSTGAEAMKFLAGFAVCYSLQLLFVWALTSHTPLGAMEWDIKGFTLSGYGVATLGGMCVYTLCNFIYNRQIAFSKRNRRA